MEWQPIETAPRGGERIAGALWSDLTKRWICMDAYWCKGLKEPKWIFDGWLIGGQPTHWMPLPEPPKE